MPSPDGRGCPPELLPGLTVASSEVAPCRSSRWGRTWGSRLAARGRLVVELGTRYASRAGRRRERSGRHSPRQWSACKHANAVLRGDGAMAIRASAGRRLYNDAISRGDDRIWVASTGLRKRPATVVPNPGRAMDGTRLSPVAPEIRKGSTDDERRHDDRGTTRSRGRGGCAKARTLVLRPRSGVVVFFFLTVRHLSDWPTRRPGASGGSACRRRGWAKEARANPDMTDIADGWTACARAGPGGQKLG